MTSIIEKSLDLLLCGLVQIHLGKIDIYVEDVVEVVGEYVQRNVGDDFRNFAVAKAGIAQGLHFGGGSFAPAGNHIFGKTEL
jgi:hypothetical protein